MSVTEQVDIVETDRMTGSKRTMWQHIDITRAKAEETVAWMEKNITNRYGYEIVATGTGPAER